MLLFVDDRYAARFVSGILDYKVVIDKYVFNFFLLMIGGRPVNDVTSLVLD